MRKLLFVALAVCAFAVAGFAQKADYSGTWKLDLGASKLDARMRIESMTLTVAQSATEVKVDTSVKRTAGPEGRAGGESSNTYSLNGSELKREMDGPNGTKVPVSFMGAKESDGSLKLSSSRTFNTPNGEMTSTTRETWKLSADGKTLTIERESSSPRGSQTSTLVFVKG